MNAAQVTHHRAPHHDVVEMGYHEVGAMNVDVDGQGGQEEAGEASHGEQTDEAQGVKHGRLVRDGSLVKSRRPVENLDGGGNRNHEAQ